MSEAGDYTPKIWKDHDFDDARAHYDKHVGRSYDDAVVKGKTTADVLPKTLSTKSSSPLVIVVDETGSMGEWPKMIFSKLPYLYNEAHDEYLGESTEVSFGAFGDASNTERYPVQARPFAGKKDVSKRLEELVIEGNGGGQMSESSELVALYYARQVEFPNAIQKPIYIFVTDEKCYLDVTPTQALEKCGVKLQSRLPTKEIFEELKEKYSVYLILKPYSEGGGDSNDCNKTVRNHWLQYVDDDHIAALADPARVVDVIFGILAKETDKIDYFKKEIEDRQDDKQVAIAYKALKTIHAVSAPPTPKMLKSGKSQMFPTKTKGAGKTKKAEDLG